MRSGVSSHFGCRGGYHTEYLLIDTVSSQRRRCEAPPLRSRPTSTSLSFRPTLYRSPGRFLSVHQGRVSFPGRRAVAREVLTGASADRPELTVGRSETRSPIALRSQRCCRLEGNRQPLSCMAVSLSAWSAVRSRPLVNERNVIPSD